jgi:hypothetical protein
MGASSVLYKRADPVVKDNILSFVQERLGAESGCEYGESLGFVHYVESKWDQNNKFGLYIYSESRDYFELAQKLVNSNGGDWGYVLIPYNVKDRDTKKWERVFEQLRNKHLIPIIQLWDVDLDNYEDQTRGAAEFLNSFIWPIKERYVSVYNEVNSADFWYGEVDPEKYAEVLDFTIDTFKEKNRDYFMMNGAFNVSAYTDSKHLDSFTYMDRMDQKVPGIFDKLDGWASHSYPQPNFSGNPFAKGRWSVNAYENELNHLELLGVSKDLPVFITETGWAHAQGESFNESFYDAELVAEYIKIAFEEVWLPDERVRAVTPFTIKYQAPYDHFSWVNKDNVPYRQYEEVRSLEKVSGNPPHYEVDSLRISGCDE